MLDGTMCQLVPDYRCMFRQRFGCFYQGLPVATSLLGVSSSLLCTNLLQQKAIGIQNPSDSSVCVWNDQRQNLEPGTKNVIRISLAPVTSLNIKLGAMKQFVKVITKDGDCFKYLCKTFKGLYEAKLKEVIFVGPSIRKLMKDN
ncbi:hypothetical protein LAZ67_11003482 [Cordylochernes scorpioides]|uniref:Uncharacterized protein n=1 Tax=Cordylochernes scorpioides TaxID=51811 RepID=A0ABY6L4Q6_9ARAC|nr:hypothetical protein LAZ67_11003482 [Cordylochernes scorpioides]